MEKNLKKFVKIIIPVGFIALVLTNFFLASWDVIHKDISFTSEIARDFLLLDELARKKIILIGPNSSTGLFHGPLWTYLNFPAYFFGQGNPVVVGWFWVFLIIVFTVINYLIAKNLFGRTAGYLFALFFSLYMAFHAGFMYNPHGALLLTPTAFFFFVKYLSAKRKLFLLFNLIFTCAIVQFQLADGIPLLLLFGLAEIIWIFRYRLWFHTLLFLSVPVSFVNFIIFDLRHEHLYAKLLFHFIVSPVRDKPDYFLLLKERIAVLFSGQEILHQDIFNLNLWLFLLTIFLILWQLKKGKFRIVYFSFLYVYFGYYLLSLFNTGAVLYFYMFPLFPLIFLIFSSFINSSFKLTFLLIFIPVYLWNFQTMVNNLSRANKFFGQAEDSWSFILSVAQKVYRDSNGEFGYFVYEPNVLAYSGKYAMLYAQRVNKNKSNYFTKKTLTYIISAPPVKSNPYLSYRWWVNSRVNIKNIPEKTISFPNGYKIEKYLLSHEEVNIPFDPGIDPGLAFR